MKTAQESFRMAVRMYCEGLDCISVGCLGEHCKYAEGDSEHFCKESFSWQQCDSCGSTLGGDRSTAYGLWKDGDQFCSIEMSICVDCVMFHANGDEPEEWGDTP